MEPTFKHLPARAALTNFTNWLRLVVALAWLLLFFVLVIASTVPAFQQTLKAVWLALAAGSISAIGLLIGAVVLLAVYSYLEVQSYRYRILEGRFEFRSGVLGARRVSLELSKIQHVEIQEPFFYRLLSLATVSISTAGSGGSEVYLPGVDQREARRLHKELTEQHGESRDEDVTVHSSWASADSRSETEPVTNSESSQRVNPQAVWLFFVGQTKNLAALILVLIGGTVSLFLDVGTVFDKLVGFGSVAVLMILYMLIEAWFKYRNFTYQLSPEALMVQSGVWSRRRSTVRWSRIQNVELYESLFHRLLGLADLRVQTAGSSRKTPELTIAGLELKKAEHLRDRCLALTGNSEL